MSIRYVIAKSLSFAARLILKYIAHRPAANFPGKLALYIDPHCISQSVKQLTYGSVVVVGTNGKTTTTNLLACALEGAGYRVACNTTGANLDSGIASTLLESKNADWAVLECDELYLTSVLGQLQAQYVLLLNLFRDQLDRAGEIDVVQKSIILALESSPNTTLLYNADDPYCAHIAASISNKSIPFGVSQALGLEQNSVVDAQICQNCFSMIEYSYYQYGHLGSYACPQCGFSRPEPFYAARNCKLDAGKLLFELSYAKNTISLEGLQTSPYMLYNYLAYASAALQLSCDPEVIQQTIHAFAPRNGRLELLEIGGRKTLINLAKNPVGFNQNLEIVLANPRPSALALFINDKEADGHDISWIWDIDFEKLAKRPDIKVYAGGIRKNDVLVRLKYAGVHACLVDSAHDFFERIALLPNAVQAYAIANYTALPEVKGELEQLERTGFSHKTFSASQAPLQSVCYGVSEPKQSKELANRKPLVIAHMFPKLLNLYGDNGNVTVLRKRLEWRGIPYELREINASLPTCLDDVDLVFLGGAPDREQRLASIQIMQMKDQLHAYVDSGGPLLAICGGYQMLGDTWLLDNEQVPGLSLAHFETRRTGSARNRLVDNVVLSVQGIKHPVVGYENHAGRTYLASSQQPFGVLISKTGHGNNDETRQDGIRFKRVIGTYLHGPLLAKNPELADALLASALEYQAQRCGIDALLLQELDDAVELAANDYMVARLRA